MEVDSLESVVDSVCPSAGGICPEILGQRVSDYVPWGRRGRTGSWTYVVQLRLRRSWTHAVQLRGSPLRAPSSWRDRRHAVCGARTRSCARSRPGFGYLVGSFSDGP